MRNVRGFAGIEMLIASFIFFAFFLLMAYALDVQTAAVSGAAHSASGFIGMQAQLQEMASSYFQTGGRLAPSTIAAAGLKASELTPQFDYSGSGGGRFVVFGGHTYYISVNQ